MCIDFSRTQRDDEMRVKREPIMVTKVNENHPEHTRNIILTNSHKHTGKWCVFARDCMWTSFQISRKVETCTRGCHNSSFTGTQDVLNISLLGVFLKMIKTKNQSFCATKDNLQAKPWNMMKSEVICDLKSRWKHAHSQGVCLLRPSRLRFLYRSPHLESNQCF